MKILKRTLSLLLVLMMCLGAGIYTVSAYGTENEMLSDIELLNMLGIFQGYEDGNLHPDWSITRMQFAALVIRALGYDNGIGQMETGFSDVPLSSWGSGYVKMSYDLGIVSGYGDGTFRPENPVTQAESVKMLVAALGYGAAAENGGGFPQGYVTYAAKLQLLDGAVSTTQQATRGYVASLIANALETGILDKALNSDKMEVTDDTILSRMGITVREGTLTAVYGASLSGDDDIEKDEVIVSDERFKTNLNISTEFIGSKVKIYVKNYGKDDELLVGITGAYSGKTLVVNADDILEGTTLTSFEYRNSNGKRDSVTLQAGLKITYNGKLVENSLDYTPQRLMPETGTVKLMDTDRNGVYDTAIVKDYKTYVVRSVNENAIYDEFGKSIKLEDDTVVSVIDNGAYKEVSDIDTGDVLSAAISLDGEIVEILICREIAEGVVTMQGEDDGEIIYSLDTGDELSLSYDYTVALSGGYNMAEKIELGSDMIFYLNYFGEIAAAEINTEGRTEGNYGYIMQMADGGRALSNVYDIEILTKNNRYEIFETSSTGKVKFGRMDRLEENYTVSKVSPEEIFNTIYINGTIVQKQMCMYRLDSNGAIKELYLADKTGNTTYFSLDGKRNPRLVSNHLIEAKYYWDDNTILFHIPLDGQYITNLSAGKVDEYFSSGTPTLELYDIEADGYVNCILYHDSDTGRALTEGGTWNVIDYVNSPVMLVTKVYHEIGDDDLEYNVIEGWENKKLVRRLMSDTLSKKATDVREGAVIQYATNERDKNFAQTADDDVTIVTYTKLFDCNNYNVEEFMLYDYTAHHFENPRIKFGYTTVTRVDNPYIRFGFDDTLAEIHPGTMIYVYNRNSKEVTKGDISDINEGEQVFFRSRYSNLREVIVFED